MHIRRYGVDLISIREDDLEPVLQWRNDPVVRNAMLYREIIEPEQHRHWFDALGSNQVYLVIHWKSQRVGLINLKDIDWKERSAEAGIFIGEPSCRNSQVPLLAILALMDTAFGELKLNLLRARVRRDHPEILQMNKGLGYRETEQDDVQVLLETDAASYGECRSRFERLLDRSTGPGDGVYLSDQEEALFSGLK